MSYKAHNLIVFVYKMSKYEVIIVIIIKLRAFVEDICRGIEEVIRVKGGSYWKLKYEIDSLFLTCYAGTFLLYFIAFLVNTLLFSLVQELSVHNHSNVAIPVVIILIARWR